LSGIEYALKVAGDDFHLLNSGVAQDHVGSGGAYD
jgi:hypothetical protein